MERPPAAAAADGGGVPAAPAAEPTSPAPAADGCVPATDAPAEAGGCGAEAVAPAADAPAAVGRVPAADAPAACGAEAVAAPAACGADAVAAPAAEAGGAEAGADGRAPEDFSGPALLLYLRCPSGTVIPLEVPADGTIAHLRAAASLAVGRPGVVLLGGQPDDTQLADSGVTSECMLEFALVQVECAEMHPALTATKDGCALHVQKSGGSANGDAVAVFEPSVLVSAAGVSMGWRVEVGDRVRGSRYAIGVHRNNPDRVHMPTRERDFYAVATVSRDYWWLEDDGTVYLDGRCMMRMGYEPGSVVSLRIIGRSLSMRCEKSSEEAGGEDRAWSHTVSIPDGDYSFFVSLFNEQASFKISVF